MKTGEVLAIHNKGPKGGPGLPEVLALTAAVKDGDVIEPDLAARTLTLRPDQAEMDRRAAAYTPPAKDLPGLPRRYGAGVRKADQGAVLAG